MIAIPAIDLRDGACVQLVGGSYAEERIRIEDPRAVASRWLGFGFRRLHVVDLDAATSRGSNRAVVRGILADHPRRVQVGGGVRSADDVASLLADGAEQVVVGTRALEDRAWLDRTAAEFPGRIILAADVRDRRVVVDGWARELSIDPVSLLAELGGVPLAGFLVTAVHREGRLGGTDLALMAAVARETSLPVHASGGITTMEDLSALADAGCAGAVLGMSLYTGALDPRAVAEEYAT
ncbi:MAG TPA: 1-(5-phosphoribosyl)-5-[(5-phosphoribosylamino)methylideneamino] imidazole-4-carboxamide isomerase [Gemmatimonadales bacterium]|nr:1-(5-phosphoribosyl)-5-[(5-phosphoribosylamino)methylideneamino] imidazole-4-carboxamide isomerase [Gemmatimonadales bacterium]